MNTRQHRLFYTLFATALCFLYSGKGYAWNAFENSLETAAPAAEELAERLASRLKKQSNHVVFIDTLCRLKREDSVKWCSRFATFLRTRLTKENIRFLSETAAAEVREKLANEQLYQQNSGQVDISKAVELGKQAAFQAFVSISIEGDASLVTVSAESISIREAAVTISETLDVKTKTESTRSWGRMIGGTFFLLGGAAIGVASLERATVFSKKSDAQYALYRESKDASAATLHRTKTEKYAKDAESFQSVATIGWLIMGVSFIYLLGGAEEVHYYEVDLANTPIGLETTKLSGTKWALDLMVVPSGGIVLSMANNF